jgi:hypothetical protein
LADHNMVILLYAVEVEILESIETPGREGTLVEAAQAYRARSRCLQALGRTQFAQADDGRAARLEAETKKLAKESNKGPIRNAMSENGPATGRLRLVNDWTEPVVVVVDGTSYRLGKGEQQSIERPAGAFSYEVEAARSRGNANLGPGETFTLRVRAP